MCENIIIGVDEAGRGPLFGNVYTSAVVLPELNFDKSLLKDSKKFTSKKKINEVFHYIINNSTNFAIDFATHEEIDKYNILQATQKSMHRSIHKLIQSLIKNKDYNEIDSILKRIKICVDGNYFNTFQYFYNNKIYLLKHECLVKGDALCKEISAASILAKVSRDKYIEQFVENNPEYDEKYGLLKNKGYGTLQHRIGIQQYGYSPYHRKSFKLKNKN